VNQWHRRKACRNCAKTKKRKSSRTCEISKEKKPTRQTYHRNCCM